VATQNRRGSTPVRRTGQACGPPKLIPSVRGESFAVSRGAALARSPRFVLWYFPPGHRWARPPLRPPPPAACRSFHPPSCLPPSAGGLVSHHRVPPWACPDLAAVQRPSYPARNECEGRQAVSSTETRTSCGPPFPGGGGRMTVGLLARWLEAPSRPRGNRLLKAE